MVFGHTPAPVADLPIDLGDGLAEQLARVLDVEAKIPRALEAAGFAGGKRSPAARWRRGVRARQLTELGARVSFAKADGPAGIDAPDASVDCIVGMWTAFRGL